MEAAKLRNFDAREKPVLPNEFAHSPHGEFPDMSGTKRGTEIIAPVREISSEGVRMTLARRVKARRGWGFDALRDRNHGPHVSRKTLNQGVKSLKTIDIAKRMAHMLHSAAIL
jgi:hypothetical protein